ncbi:hypothetical protein DID88_000032 [Monilinia fructigena]|uniref:Uncharacterized protein n=1 Tax=Monilinia fructigena TaxID=38457 RepID=A0A395IIQ9_9HELO|nr:hypothetical protein DID88_000032 [Monilinia fructigena]
MSRSIPPLLSPYLSLPSESSLILLTSVLGAGTNWLVLRYLSSLLSESSPQSSTDSGGNENGDENGEVKVIFFEFYEGYGVLEREGARKINLDLDRLTQQNRFHFIDGLSILHLPPSTPKPSTHTTLQDPTLQTLSQTLSHAITTLTTPTPTSQSKPILLIDAPDLLLATSPSPPSPPPSPPSSSPLAKPSTPQS